MPLDQTDLEAMQVQQLLEARGWTIVSSTRTSIGLAISATRPPIVEAHHLDRLQDLQHAPPPPKG